MVTIDDIRAFREQYAGMTQKQVIERAKSDTAFKLALESLYEGVYHERLNHSCSNCYVDAYVLVTRKAVDSMIQSAERQFELKAGALLLDVVNHDNALMVTHHNLTDELALYHLRTCPSYISKFKKYPENWRELASASNAESGGGETNVQDEAVKKAESLVKACTTKLAKARESGDDGKITKAEAALEKAKANLAAVSGGQSE